MLTIAARATDDAEIGTYVLAVTATDKADAMVAHTTTLTIADTENEPIVSVPLSNRLVPATGMTLTLDLTDFITDTDEEGDESSAGELTFAISESVPGTGDTNIITAMLTGAMMDVLELTPGTGTIVDGFGQQETVSITATDSDDKQAVVEFAVTTRANVLDTGMLAPAHGFIIQGDTAGDLLGSSVSGAGDVNGDGLADLITGAAAGDDGGASAGEAYIVYGKAGTTGTQFGMPVGSRQILDTTDLAPAAGFILQADTAGDNLGISVSGAGDVNGDGIDDLIAGAYIGGNSGEAYIVYGKTGTGSQFGTDMGPEGMKRQVVDTTNLKPADGFIIRGDTAVDLLGGSVSGAGDINGDGIDDLIAGAYFGDDGGSNAGEAYIIYGKANPAEGDAGTQFGTKVGTTGMEHQVLDTTNLAPAAGFIIQGHAVEDQLGMSVSGAGDINGDGLVDLIVGASAGDDGGMAAGEAYIVYGKAGTDGTQFGQRVAIAGSTVSTLTNSQAAPDGSVVRRVLDTASLSVTDGFILQGDRGGDQLGISVSGAGDINGDGYDDLIAGAEQGMDGGLGAGEAYIIYGQSRHR